jgi:hypothetical protein
LESGFERWPPTDGERLIALDDEVGFKGNRALDELVVARVGADDLELWYLGREEDLNPPIEQRRGFLELRQARAGVGTLGDTDNRLGFSRQEHNSKRRRSQVRPPICAERLSRR